MRFSLLSLTLPSLALLSLTLFGGLILFPCNATAATIYVYKDAKGSLTFTDAPIRKRDYKLISTQYKNSSPQKKWNGSKSSTKNITSQYDHYISVAARSHSLDPSLIKAVIHTESYFNTHARSTAGALGLMQLMPATAGIYNVNDPYNPKQNILAGSEHLSLLLKKYNGDLDFALAAYNAGEGSVSRYNGIPPYKETREYVVKVKRLHQRYKLDLSAVR